MAKGMLKLKELEGPAAKERQKSHGGTAPGKAKNTCGNISTSVNGPTRDKIGRAYGVSGRQAEKMMKVLEAAESEPDKQGHPFTAQRLTLAFY